MADKANSNEAGAPRKGRRGGVNKMEAVRQALDALGLDAKPLAIQKHLKERGINMTPDHISNYKSDIRKKAGKRRRRGRKPGPKPAAAAAKPAMGNGRKHGLSLGDVETVKSLLKRLGVDGLRHLINVLVN
jgi:hypothetical protein